MTASGQVDDLDTCIQTRQEGEVEGVSYPGPHDVSWAPPSARNIKYTRIFSTEGPRENVWGPHENVSPGPAKALDGPASIYIFIHRGR